VREIRGRGLMIGIEMDMPCQPIMKLALERGLLINVTAERVVRLLPPLILTDTEANEVVMRTADSVRAFTGDLARSAALA
jgi:acetylornithine aminotransferase